MINYIFLIISFFAFLPAADGCDILPPPPMAKIRLPLFRGRWRHYGIEQGLPSLEALSLLSATHENREYLFAGLRGQGLFFLDSPASRSPFASVTLDIREPVSVFQMVQSSEFVFAATSHGVAKIALSPRPHLLTFLNPGTPFTSVVAIEGKILGGTTHGILAVGDRVNSKNSELAAQDVLAIAKMRTEVLIGARAGLFTQSDSLAEARPYPAPTPFSEVSRLAADTESFLMTHLQGLSIFSEGKWRHLGDYHPPLKQWHRSFYSHQPIPTLAEQVGEEGDDTLGRLSAVRSATQKKLDALLKRIVEIYKEQNKKYQEAIRDLGKGPEAHNLKDRLAAEMAAKYAPLVAEYNRIEKEYFEFLKTLADKALWLGSEREGLFVLLGRDLIHYSRDNSMLLDAKISDIARTSGGHYWFATENGGIYRFFIGPILGADVQILSRRPSQNLHLTGDKLYSALKNDGLELFDWESKAPIDLIAEGLGEVSTEKISDFATVPPAGLFFATLGNGIFQYGDRKLTHFDEKSGLKEKEIVALGEVEGAKLIAAGPGGEITKSLFFLAGGEWRQMTPEVLKQELSALLKDNKREELKALLRELSITCDEEALKSGEAFAEFLQGAIPPESPEAEVRVIRGIGSAILLGTQEGVVHLFDRDLRSRLTETLEPGVGPVRAIAGLKSGTILVAGTQGVACHATKSFVKVSLPEGWGGMEITDLKPDSENPEGFWISAKAGDGLGAIGYFDGQGWFNRAFPFSIERFVLNDTFLFGASATGTFRLAYNP